MFLSFQNNYVKIESMALLTSERGEINVKN